MNTRRLVRLALPALLAVTLACGPLDVVRDILRDLGRAYCEDPLRVTKVEDTNDGVCGEDDCSLREAVIAANECEGEQTIIIAERTTYELTLEGRDEDEAATGDLDIWDDVNIFKIWPPESAPLLVPPATLDAGGVDRIFDVHEGTLLADWLILINGSAERGGAIRIAEGASAVFSIVYVEDSVAASDGGAVFNSGRFHGNYPTGFLNNRATRGAAVFSTGVVNLAGCFIYENTADQGVLFIDADGEINLQGCSVANNQGTGVINRGRFTFLQGDIVDHLSSGAGVVVSEAIALFNEPGAEADLDTLTISGNQSTGPGAAVILNLGKLNLHNVTMYQNNPVDIGISNPGDGETVLENTILALSGERSCHGTLRSLGGNMLTDPACGLRVDLGDMLVEADSIGLLPSGGEDLRFFPLESSSPAVDGGTGSCYFEDIRRHPRPIDGDGDGELVCDSGSYEFEAMEALSLAVTPLPLPSPEPTLAPSVTPIPPPTVAEDTLCWKGPGSDYETVSSLLTGTEVELLGRGEIEGWWVIDNPRYPGVPCWLPEDGLDVDPDAIPPDLEVFPVPPLPTPTATPILGCLYQDQNQNQPVCYPIENCPVDFEDSLGACTP